MILRALCLIFCAGSLFAQESVELFLYWQWQGKAQELFPLKEGEADEALGLLPLIRKKLEAKGVSIQSWELDAHRTEVLSWASIHSWSDFWCWVFPKRPCLEDKIWVFWSLGPYLKDASFKRLPKDKLILYLWEPPTVEDWSYVPALQSQFGTIFTWDDDLVDNRKFFKFYYPVLAPRIANIVPFEEKKFCVMVATRLCSKHPRELYSEREKVIRFFEALPSGVFDLYGRNWEKRKFKNWRGATPNKLETIKQYKFSICYENMRDVKGYVTEKIFDCLAAGTVPVYWGASNIGEYVPAECFIDRRQFESETALLEFLNSITEQEYARYLESAEAFLRSKEANRFTNQNLVDGFVSSVCKTHP